MFTIMRKTFAEVWRDVLIEIFARGEDCPVCEHQTPTKFLNLVVANIDGGNYEPYKFDPFCKGGKKFEAYKAQFKPGMNKTGFDYTYYDLLTIPVDQLAWLRQQLASGRAHSRRLQITTWRPNEHMNVDNPPCFQGAWVYPLGNKQVDIHLRWRSWDWFGAAGANIPAVMNMLDEEVLSPNGLKVRNLGLIGDNVHFYKTDIDKVEAVVMKNPYA